MAYALSYLADAQGLRGEFLDAIATAEEGRRIAADTGQVTVTGELAARAASLAAVTGDEEGCRARAAQVRELSARAQTPALAGADCALALLDLGYARYQAALDRMQAAVTGPTRHSPHLLYAYPDHVEAAVRAAVPDSALLPAQAICWESGRQGNLHVTTGAGTGRSAGRWPHGSTGAGRGAARSPGRRWAGRLAAAGTRRHDAGTGRWWIPA